MDREKLERKLNTDFKDACFKRNYPLREICLEEAYPGDVSTSFVVKVVADWVKDMDCSHALDILIDILWETTEVEFREAIFAIKIYSEGTLHCQTVGNEIENVNTGNFEFA